MSSIYDNNGVFVAFSFVKKCPNFCDSLKFWFIFFFFLKNALFSKNAHIRFEMPNFVFTFV